MTLPDGLKFLAFGWWLVHAMAFLIVFQFGYRRGKGDERRAQKQRELEKAR